MKSRLFLAIAFVAASALAACGGAATPAPSATTQSGSKPAGDQSTVAAFQKGTCGTCHIIPGIPNAAGVVGPSLSGIAERAASTIKDKGYTGKAQNVPDYLRESIEQPDLYLASGCPGGACLKGTMPATLAGLVSQQELASIVNYLAALR